MGPDGHRAPPSRPRRASGSAAPGAPPRRVLHPPFHRHARIGERSGVPRRDAAVRARTAAADRARGVAGSPGPPPTGQDRAGARPRGRGRPPGRRDVRGRRGSDVRGGRRRRSDGSPAPATLDPSPRGAGRPPVRLLPRSNGLRWRHPAGRPRCPAAKAARRHRHRAGHARSGLGGRAARAGRRRRRRRRAPRRDGHGTGSAPDRGHPASRPRPAILAPRCFSLRRGAPPVSERDRRRPSAVRDLGFRRLRGTMRRSGRLRQHPPRRARGVSRRAAPWPRRSRDPGLRRRGTRNPDRPVRPLPDPRARPVRRRREPRQPGAPGAGAGGPGRNLRPRRPALQAAQPPDRAPAAGCCCGGGPEAVAEGPARRRARRGADRGRWRRGARRLRGRRRADGSREPQPGRDLAGAGDPVIGRRRAVAGRVAGRVPGCDPEPERRPRRSRRHRPRSPARTAWWSRWRTSAPPSRE